MPAEAAQSVLPFSTEGFLTIVCSLVALGVPATSHASGGLLLISPIKSTIKPVATLTKPTASFPLLMYVKEVLSA